MEKHFGDNNEGYVLSFGLVSGESVVSYLDQMMQHHEMQLGRDAH